MNQARYRVPTVNLEIINIFRKLLTKNFQFVFFILIITLRIIIMNEENEWDQNVKAQLRELVREEVAKAIREMKVGKAAGPSEVSIEMIAASGEIGIGVMVELCQGVLD